VLKRLGLWYVGVTLKFVVTVNVHGLKIGFMDLFILQTVIVRGFVGCNERYIARGVVYVIFVMGLMLMLMHGMGLLVFSSAVFLLLIVTTGHSGT